MEINPGGQLDPRHIVGRDAEIARYWKILSRQGLILSAERRIGKTHIAKKMRHFPQEGFAVCYQDLEGVYSILDLTRSLYGAVGPMLDSLQKLKGIAAAAWAVLAPKRIGEFELPSAADNWKLMISTAIADVLEHLPESHRLVLIWDEFPLMLYNLKRAKGGSLPAELLDHLRVMRQQHNRLRFVFTGSIGLHLVLRELRKEGHANDPVNDMLRETVPGMCEADAKTLGCILLGKLDAKPGNVDLLAAKIFELTEGFPHYIQHVVDQLSLLGREPTVQDVNAAFDSLLLSEHDPASFRYYHNRINTYYSKEERPIARAILDVLCREGTLTFPSLVSKVGVLVPDLNEETLRDVLQVLREDHYIMIGDKNEGAVRYRFRWTFLSRWWKENRV